VRSHRVLNPVLGVALLLATAVVAAQNIASILADDRGSDLPVTLTATVVATGIPGAGAIAQAGTFHKGGPFAPGGALMNNTAASRLLSLRPHPTLHPRFPQVSMNPDGSFGYDVQNLMGGVGVQKHQLGTDVGEPGTFLRGPAAAQKEDRDPCQNPHENQTNDHCALPPMADGIEPA